MGQPLSVTIDLAKYVAKQKLRGRKRFPMVLMLEPTENCNLSCTGCGKVRQSEDVLNGHMTAQECFDAVDECGAPVVSIAGGEPLVHPEIMDIVDGMMERRKLTLLCTNGLLLHRYIDKLKPNPRLSLVFHLDGPREHHDKMVERKGVYDIVIKGIQEAKRRGFHITTNTTLYKGVDPKGIAQMLQDLTAMGVDNCLVSPAFTYVEVDPVHSDIYLSRKDTVKLVSEVVKLAGPKVNYYNTPMFLDFLQGRRELECKPWGNPTRNPKGWKGPCYLLTDGHYETFDDLMNQTDWDKYGYGKDPRCASCMMHSGYEVSAIDHMSPADMVKMVSWIFAS